LTPQILALTNVPVVKPGDCGSWVIDKVTRVLYGHVVASDVFGDAYVVPIDAILRDIKTLLGAESVSLPGPDDLLSEPAQYSDSALFVENRASRQHTEPPKPNDYQTWFRGARKELPIQSSGTPAGECGPEKVVQCNYSGATNQSTTEITSLLNSIVRMEPSESKREIGSPESGGYHDSGYSSTMSSPGQSGQEQSSETTSSGRHGRLSSFTDYSAPSYETTHFGTSHSDAARARRLDYSNKNRGPATPEVPRHKSWLSRSSWRNTFKGIWPGGEKDRRKSFAVTEIRYHI
jgi:hypothetical protein